MICESIWMSTTQNASTPVQLANKCFNVEYTSKSTPESVILQQNHKWIIKPNYVCIVLAALFQFSLKFQFWNGFCCSDSRQKIFVHSYITISCSKLLQTYIRFLWRGNQTTGSGDSFINWENCAVFHGMYPSFDSTCLNIPKRSVFLGSYFQVLESFIVFLPLQMIKFIIILTPFQLSFFNFHGRMMVITFW